MPHRCNTCQHHPLRAGQLKLHSCHSPARLLAGEGRPRGRVFLLSLPRGRPPRALPPPSKVEATISPVWEKSWRDSPTSHLWPASGPRCSNSLCWSPGARLSSSGANRSHSPASWSSSASSMLRWSAQYGRHRKAPISEKIGAHSGLRLSGRAVGARRDNLAALHVRRTRSRSPSCYLGVRELRGTPPDSRCSGSTRYRMDRR
jgi:hypothetical protein